jgi:hypothetical protein
MTKYAVINRAKAKYECAAVLFNTKKKAISFCKKQSAFSGCEYIVIDFGFGKIVTSYKDGKESNR